jgi:hypothetical protein
MKLHEFFLACGAIEMSCTASFFHVLGNISPTNVELIKLLLVTDASKSIRSGTLLAHGFIEQFELISC